MTKYHLRRRQEKTLLWPFVTAFVFIVIAIVGGARYWYVTNIKPLDENSENYVRFVVESGESVGEIADGLEEEGLIRNSTAFLWYVRGASEDKNIQAGVYSLSPSMSVENIIKTMNLGKTDARLLTILPGKRLDELANILLEQGGWDVSDVAKALDTRYQHPFLEKVSEPQDLEGLIFPDSYEVNDETTADELIIKTLDNFLEKVEERDLESKLKKQGLTLYEGIILASIVEKEAGSVEDKPTIAQVFLSRLEQGIQLGADPTFLYAAEKLGVPPTVDIDSPYNTRINTGLPPGPIANFNITSLEAVAEPADTDYLFFVSGDNGNTYFSKTLKQHQEYTAKYCIDLCKLPQD